MGTTVAAANTADLAKRIQDCYGRVVLRGREAVEAAMDAGDAILEARQVIPRGEWTAWLTENTTVSVPTSYQYERLAMARPEIEAAGTVIGSIAEAIKIIGPPRVDSGTGRPSIERATGRSEVRGSGRPARVEINSAMLERAAKWIVVRNPTRYGGRVTEKAYREAHEMLLFSLNNEAPR